VQVNLKVVFPEQGIVGGFQRSIPNRNLGTSVDVIDPQQ
jgi:hypothetical protein